MNPWSDTPAPIDRLQTPPEGTGTAAEGSWL